MFSAVIAKYCLLLFTLLTHSENCQLHCGLLLIFSASKMHQSHPEAAGISSGLILRLPTHEPEKNGFD